MVGEKFCIPIIDEKLFNRNRFKSFPCVGNLTISSHNNVMQLIDDGIYRRVESSPGTDHYEPGRGVGGGAQPGRYGCEGKTESIHFFVFP